MGHPSGVNETAGRDMRAQRAACRFTALAVAVMIAPTKRQGRPAMTAFVRLLACLAGLALTTAASAADYPDRNVRVLVPFAQADGYTILVVSTGFMVNPSLYAKVPYDPLKDFTPLTLAAVSPNVIFVNPSLPVKTLKELIDLVKANPGKYAYAQPAMGSTPHLSAELLKQTFGLDLVMVPFTSAGLAVNAVLSGQPPIGFTALPPTIGLINQGKLRGLAVEAVKRAPTLPDVPTIAEAGVPGQEADTLTGFVLPAGTPPAIVEKLHSEMVKIGAMPEIRERLEKIGFNPVINTPAEFGARIKAEMEKWAKVVHAANLRIE